MGRYNMEMILFTRQPRQSRQGVAISPMAYKPCGNWVETLASLSSNSIIMRTFGLNNIFICKNSILSYTLVYQNRTTTPTNTNLGVEWVGEGFVTTSSLMDHSTPHSLEAVSSNANGGQCSDLISSRHSPILHAWGWRSS